MLSDQDMQMTDESVDVLRDFIRNEVHRFWIGEVQLEAGDVRSIKIAQIITVNAFARSLFDAICTMRGSSDYEVEKDIVDLIARHLGGGIYERPGKEETC